jgi:hypothetical protein
LHKWLSQLQNLSCCQKRSPGPMERKVYKGARGTCAHRKRRQMEYSSCAAA